MLIPVRCFSCGNPVANYFDEFVERTNPADKGGKGELIPKVLNDLGISRVCCRRMLVSNVELIDEILPYPRY